MRRSSVGSINETGHLECPLTHPVVLMNYVSQRLITGNLNLYLLTCAQSCAIFNCCGILKIQKFWQKIMLTELRTSLRHPNPNPFPQVDNRYITC